MIFGYARVSTDDQVYNLQLNALKDAGVERIFTEAASGSRWNRPELHRMIDQLRENDVVIVWKLDRLSRSLKDLLHLIEDINQKKAGFRSLTENIDTTTPPGRLMMQMIGSFAEFERSMIKERTLAGLNAARLEGRIGGRRSSLSLQQQQTIIQMVTSGQQTAAQTAKLFKVHPATISRLLAKKCT
jgi:DNA invertase Pin-like site-specific DNA recombinase